MLLHEAPAKAGCMLEDANWQGDLWLAAQCSTHRLLGGLRLSLCLCAAAIHTPGVFI